MWREDFSLLDFLSKSARGVDGQMRAVKRLNR